VPQSTPAFISEPDFQKLISPIPEKWFKQLVVFTVATGMRRGEVLNLTWQMVDLQRRFLHIESGGDFWTKGGKKRTIPLNELALRVL
jgi:integrase